MPRYIDAEKLCELARNHINKSVDCNDIMRFPTADVQEVKHGHWKFSCYAMNGQSLSECQNCGGCFWQPKEDPFRFCPDCGAKMD